jgi:hypothetical protein
MVPEQRAESAELAEKKEEHAPACQVVGAPPPWPFSIVSRCRCCVLTGVESRHSASTRVKSREETRDERRQETRVSER